VAVPSKRSGPSGRGTPDARSKLRSWGEHMHIR